VMILHPYLRHEKPSGREACAHALVKPQCASGHTSRPSDAAPVRGGAPARVGRVAMAMTRQLVERTHRGCVRHAVQVSRLLQARLGTRLRAAGTLEPLA
jgi:hypothetical protein